MQDNNRLNDDFIPDLCSVQSVLALVLVGELLAVAMVVVDLGIRDFDWAQLGSVSMMVQWVVLASAGSLCPMRKIYNRMPAWLAGSMSYGQVIGLTAVVSAIGQFVMSSDATVDLMVLLQHVLISAVFAGVALRYIYIQAQLKNQQRAELEARIQALQSRIRPHFLFNSMNSIASLIVVDPDLAEKMVEDLSQLFRSSLGKPGIVPISQELKLCERFAAIEQLRLGDRLKVNWQLPDKNRLTEISVPSFLLQPLLENAIYHGIQPLMEGGVVTVKVELVDNAVDILVHNPVKENYDGGSDGNGVALHNISSRLSAYYGRQGQMNVISGDKEFTVHVKCPAKP